MISCKRPHLDASFDLFLQIPALRSLPPSSLHVVHCFSSGSGLHPCALTPRNARQNGLRFCQDTYVLCHLDLVNKATVLMYSMNLGERCAPTDI